jgi:hypothetical protein
MTEAEKCNKNCNIITTNLLKRIRRTQECTVQIDIVGFFVCHFLKDIDSMA